MTKLIEIKAVLKDDFDNLVEVDGEGEAIDETHPGEAQIIEIFSQHNLGGVSVIMVMGKNIVFECTENSFRALQALITQGEVDAFEFLAQT